MTDIGRLVRDITEEMRGAQERGEVATYIPPLARIDPRQFGLCVVTADGEVHASGELRPALALVAIWGDTIFTRPLGGVGL